MWLMSTLSVLTSFPRFELEQVLQKTSSKQLCHMSFCRFLSHCWSMNSMACRHFSPWCHLLARSSRTLWLFQFKLSQTIVLPICQCPLIRVQDSIDICDCRSFLVFHQLSKCLFQWHMLLLPTVAALSLTFPMFTCRHHKLALGEKVVKVKHSRRHLPTLSYNTGQLCPLAKFCGSLFAHSQEHFHFDVLSFHFAQRHQFYCFCTVHLAAFQQHLTMLEQASV